jgi:hypothetical protein
MLDGLEIAAFDPALLDWLVGVMLGVVDNCPRCLLAGRNSSATPFAPNLYHLSC